MRAVRLDRIAVDASLAYWSADADGRRRLCVKRGAAATSLPVKAGVPAEDDLGPVSGSRC